MRDSLAIHFSLSSIRTFTEVTPMFRALRPACVLPVVLILAAVLPLHAQASKPTIAQYIGTSEPLEVTSAQKADRIAWIAYDRGMRNVFTAAGPTMKPVRLTNFMEDNGVDLTEISISADGSTVV